MREFGQYRIEALIGSGGMGEVHRAYDIRRDRQVALKLLPDSFSQDAEYQRRFRRESYAVARLREPHIIPIHDYGEIDNRLFIDMRLVDGPSLATLLAEYGQMSPARAVRLLCQVAEALDAAHADGLVHRDIKPSNILVTANDFVYVVDFGIAHTIGHTSSSLSMTGARLGTLDYMAPERFENRPIDRRTDVYSLACVLFECLTGVKPYPGEDLPSLMYGHLFGAPPKPSEANPIVPAEFDAVVAQGMAKDPDQRFPTAGELAAAARTALMTAATGADTGAPVGAGHAGSVEGSAPTISMVNPPATSEASAAPTVQLVRPGAVPVPGGPASAATSGFPGPAVGDADPTVAVLLAEPPTPPAPPVPARAPGGGSRRTVVLLAVITILAVAVAVASLLVATRGGSDVAGPPAANPPATVPVAQGPRPVGNSIAKPTVGTTVPVGPTPGYMEIAPNGMYAYIANRAAGVLTVFDTTRNVVTGTIPVPDGGPQFISFSPDGTRAYISIFNNERTVNVVGVLDTASNTFLATVPVGVRPFALDVTPDGRRVYVPNHDSGSITVIDTATNTVAQTIAVAPNPHWLEISKDGSRLYAANHESNLISVVDTATDTVLATVPVGISPHSTSVHPSKPLVFNVNYDSNSVSVIDRNTNAVIATIPTGSHPQDISLAADGRHGYLATVDENAIEVFNTETFQITASVPTGRSPTSVAVTPDGRQAYVTNLADGTVTVLNIAGTA